MEAVSFSHVGHSLAAVAYASRNGLSRARRGVLGQIGAIRQAFGVVPLATGVAILTPADKWFEAQVVDLLPDAWIGATTLFQAFASSQTERSKL